MSLGPDHGRAVEPGALLDAAIGETEAALELPREQPLRARELSVLLKHYASGVLARRFGGIRCIREARAKADAAVEARLRLDLDGVIGRFDAVFFAGLAAHPRVRLSDGWTFALFSAEQSEARRQYFDRLRQLTWEHLRSERVSPELRVRPLGALAADALADELPGSFTHGVVFSSHDHFTDELYPLILDAYDQNQREYQGVMTNVVGVHVDSLTPDGRATRIIYWDHTSRALDETDLALPLPLDSVQFMCLGAQEQPRHEQLSAQLAGIPQVNPYATAGIADNKHLTAQALKAASVPTPATVRITKDAAPAAAQAALRELLAGQRAAGSTAAVVVQPTFGTEGRGVLALPFTSAEVAEDSPLLAGVLSHQRTHGDIVVRLRVGTVGYPSGSSTHAADLRLNVAWDGRDYRAESGFLQVAGDPDAVASSVARGGRIVPLARSLDTDLGLTAEDWNTIRRGAEAAVAAVSAGRKAEERLALAGVDIKLDRKDGRIIPWILDVNPRPSGLSHSVMCAELEPGVACGLWRGLAEDSVRRHVLGAIRQNRDATFEELFTRIGRPEFFSLLLDDVLAFLRETGSSRVALLQERAILVAGDALWRLKQLHATPERARLDAILADITPAESTRADILKVIHAPELLAGGHDDYLAFINQFMPAVNEREMVDFRAGRLSLLENVPQKPSQELRIVDAGKVYEAVSPMRVGVSSANASDNWTFSKLIGGKVVNFAVDLATTDGAEPRPPFTATLEVTSAPGLQLQTVSQLDTDRPTLVHIREENARDFFAATGSGALDPKDCFKDIKDPLVMLKYAFVFSRIVGYKEDPEAYARDPKRALQDIARFTGGRGLKLVLRSEGPSRSGFASSSCVALVLLRVLYGASGQEGLAERPNLASLALLLENEVGLKSGKQDTDGPLYPGVKSIRYLPTEGFLASDITQVTVDETQLREHLVLVNSGIQRPPATGLRRGLNMRHYTYVSRDRRAFWAVLRSLAVHDEIVAALAAQDWARLGMLFTEYMDLREVIDDGATQSIYDHAAGMRVLRYPFEHLRERGLVHGGMFTGAMGGGCLMLIPTPAGREIVGGTTRLLHAIEEMRGFAVGSEHPFARMQVYRYAVNMNGLEYRTRKA